MVGCAAGWAPDGSQTVTIASTVSITLIVEVRVMSCLFSKGMEEDKTKRALKARVVDSFIAPDEEALDIEMFLLEIQLIMSVVNRLAIVLLGWSFGMEVVLFAGVNVGKEIEVLREGIRKVNAGSQRLNE